MTKIRFSSLDTLKKVYIVNDFEAVVCDTCDSYDAMLYHGNQHSQHPKIYKNQKFRIKMEGDTKIQSFKAQKMDKSTCSWLVEKFEENKKKTCSKGDTQCKSNINTVAKELVSENIAR